MEATWIVSIAAVLLVGLPLHAQISLAASVSTRPLSQDQLSIGIEELTSGRNNLALRNSSSTSPSAPNWSCPCRAGYRGRRLGLRDRPIGSHGHVEACLPGWARRDDGAGA
jgi:hypothetical protein